MKIKHFLFLVAAALMSACANVDDITIPDDGKADPVNPIDLAKVTLLQQHTAQCQGDKGYPIVFMADGFTQQDINDGTYRQAVTSAIRGLFQYEPMKSLRPYVDVYEITAASTERGITTEKHNTVFSTRLAGGKSTNIYGDSIMVFNYGAKALGNVPSEYNRAMYVVLLHSSEYAGVTLLGYDQTVTDSIPSGYSISYIPAYCKTKEMPNDRLLPLLVQHEVVGHGIGKLTDEYFYDKQPQAKDVEQYESARKYGLLMNCRYKKNGGTYFAVEPWSFFYPLTQDDDYAAEGLRWYEGANTFPKQFYRPTFQGMMNETLKAGNDWFNAPSRLMIYKRIMREAMGKAFTCDLTKASDYERFKTFDAPARRPLTSGAKAIGATPATDTSLPPLAPPVLINIDIDQTK